MRTKTTRQFLGKVDGFANKTERHFYQRMLRAYLKGNTHFRFGTRQQKNAVGIMETVPAYYPVQQKYSQI